MSKKNQKPGTHPARKGKQHQQPHSGRRRDEPKTAGVESQGEDEFFDAIEGLADTGVGGGERPRRAEKPKKAEKPQLRNDLGVPQPGQARGHQMEAYIAQEQQRYSRTEWYGKAIKAGFKNRAALDRFNQTVFDCLADIDALKAPVCMECGRSELVLCEHFVVGHGVEVADDDAVMIPAAIHMRFRFDFVNKVRRMFTWPRFDSDAVVNHNINGFDNADLPDDYTDADLLAYIRLNMNTSYVINGSYDRAARLAHAKKIALRFLDEKKIPLAQRSTVVFVNRLMHTVQRSVDQQDDDMLLRESNPVHNFWVAPSDLWGWRGLAITGIAVMSPILARRLVIANLRVHLFAFGRLAQANVEILQHGSVLILRCAYKIFKSTVNALVSVIGNGIVMPCYTAIRQSSCRIVRTTCTRVCISGISSVLPNFNGTSLIGP